MVINCVSLLFFKQTTAYDLRISDWSSDVCSSDLFGSVALASSHTETGKKVRELGLGYTFEAPEVDSLVAFLRGYSMAEHLARRDRILALPLQAFCDLDDTRRLCELVLDLPRRPRRRADRKSTRLNSSH